MFYLLAAARMLIPIYDVGGFRMGIFSSSAKVSHGGKTRNISGHRQREMRSLLPPSAENETASRGGFVPSLVSALFALPVTLVIGLIFLLIATAVAYVSADPDRLSTPLAMSALGLSAMLGGLVSARRGRGQPILCGALLGLLLTVCLLGGSLFYGDDTRAYLTIGLSPIAEWGIHGAVVLLSALGGRIGRRHLEKSKKPQRRSHT